MAASTVTALRRKIIIVALAALVAALIIIFAIVNLCNHVLATERIDSVIAVLYENGGTFPENWKNRDPRYRRGTFQATSETPFETRYFVASFNSKRVITSIDSSHVAQLDETEARETLETILGSKNGTGYYDRYRYHIFTETDGSGMVIVVDRFQQLQSSKTLLVISAAVIGATAVVTLLLIIPLSRRFVDPYVRNLERQKRFVADASHELKTPVAIIAANTDLIELARTDEPIERSLRTDVDIASVVMREAEDFLPLAEASGKGLSCRVETLEGRITATGTEPGLPGTDPAPGAPSSRRATEVLVNGNPEEVDRLMSVLIENAVKYCDDGGSVRIELTERKREVLLVVSNPCASLPQQETRRLFDRFYRADTSRSRSTGGYGIGLSIAQSIVTRHEGSIRAKKVGDVLQMQVSLPRRQP